MSTNTVRRFLLLVVVENQGEFTPSQIGSLAISLIIGSASKRIVLEYHRL